jgi:uncharacterized coiled-coil protein SlyX
MGLSKFLGAIIIILGMIVFFLYQENAGLHEDLSTERANVKIATDALQEQRIANVELRADFRNQANEIDELDAQIKEWGELYDQKEQELNSWRSRLEQDTLRRPEVVRRAARRAINRSLRDAELATGSDQDGGSRTNASPAAAGESPGTEGDRADRDDAGSRGPDDRESEVR